MCSPCSDTSGRPAKMTTTISSSVSSSEPGTDADSALRPATSNSVSHMMPNSATAASRPQSRSSSWLGRGRIYFSWRAISAR